MPIYMNDRHSWSKISTASIGIKISQCKKCSLLRITRLYNAKLAIKAVSPEIIKNYTTTKFSTARTYYYIRDKEFKSAKDFKCYSVEDLIEENELLKNKEVFIKIITNGSKLIL